MKFYTKLGITLICILMMSLTLLVACDDDDTDDPTEAATPTQTQTSGPATSPDQTPVEDVTIKIGNLTDVTGPAAFAMTVVNTALKDIVRYSNEQGLIPGVELEVIDYDGQYDPSRDIPGYEYLKQKGADFILTGLPNVPITLQSFVNDDKTVLVCMSADQESVLPPGYTFAINSSTADKTKTILKWIAENDWDYETNGPAEIGIVAWGTSYFTAQEEAAREYIDANPGQFEWGGSYFTEMAFTFAPEVNETKDFDYILPPGAALINFVKEYYQADGKAKLLMTDAHYTNLGRVTEAGIWDVMDGSFFTLPGRWWNEDAELSVLAKQLLTEYHGEGKLNEYMEDGGAYIGSFHQLYSLIDMVKSTVEKVGAENFSSQALHDSLEQFSTKYGDSYEAFGFSETDRFGHDHEAIYVADGNAQQIVRVHEEWLPLVK